MAPSREEITSNLYFRNPSCLYYRRQISRRPAKKQRDQQGDYGSSVGEKWRWPRLLEWPWGIHRNVDWRLERCCRANVSPAFTNNKAVCDLAESLTSGGREARKRRPEGETTPSGSLGVNGKRRLSHVLCHLSLTTTSWPGPHVHMAPTLQVRETRHRGGQLLSWTDPASAWQSQDVMSGGPAADPVLLSTTMRWVFLFPEHSCRRHCAMCAVPPMWPPFLMNLLHDIGIIISPISQRRRMRLRIRKQYHATSNNMFPIGNKSASGFLS